MSITDPSGRSGERIARPAPSEEDVARNAAVGWLIGPIFIGLAAWFLSSPNLAPLPERESVSVPFEAVSTQPLRQVMLGEPTINAGGFDLKCSECHRLFPSRTDARSTMAQHAHIVLDHGLNDLCLNCHDRFNRNRLRLHDGSTVAFEEAQLLCSNCHGTTYRDWQAGMHGRTNGYWNEQFGERRRLICTECHDPHAPAIGPMAPLPGPHTLRMGERTASHGGAAGSGKRNPLLQQFSGDGRHGPDDTGGNH